MSWLLPHLVPHRAVSWPLPHLLPSRHDHLPSPEPYTHHYFSHHLLCPPQGRELADMIRRNGEELASNVEQVVDKVGGEVVGFLGPFLGEME